MAFVKYGLGDGCSSREEPGVSGVDRHELASSLRDQGGHEEILPGSTRANPPLDGYGRLGGEYLRKKIFFLEKVLNGKCNFREMSIRENDCRDFVVALICCLAMKK